MKARIKTLFLLPALLAAFWAPISTHAATITWTNTAGGNWSVTNNWSPNRAPASSDTAVITNGGNYAVTLDVSSAVAGLVLGASSGVTTQTFSINGPTFTLNGQATVNPNGVFNFLSGNLAGTAVLAGTLNVQGGVLNLSGSLTVAANGVLDVVGSGNFQIEGPLTNNGTVNWLGGTVQVINNNTPSYKGAIWNQAGARWYIQCNQVLDDDVGTGYEVFNNAGLLCKTNVSGTTTVYTYVNNTGGGTVQAQIGTIQIAAGSNLGGTFQAVSGAAIDFTGGNYFWNGTAVFEGPGTVAITGGSVTVTSYITSPLAVSGVTVTNLSNLGGSAYLTNVTITDAETIVGTVYWAGATVAVSGSLTVAANGVLDVVGSGNFQIEGPLTNNGTVNWLGGTVQVINNNTPSYKGAIWNQAGARWYIQCNQVLDDDVGTGYEVFNNAGLLCKTNVSGTTTVYTYVNNTGGGTVQAQIGTIQIAAGSNLGGTFQAVSGAAIDFTGGNYFWNGTAVFEGPGTVAITGGSVTVTSYITSPLAVSGVTVTNLSNLGGSAYLTNVTITDAETIVGTVYWAGATVAVSGSLTVAANGVLDVVGSGNFQIEGPLTNNGTVNWLGGTVQVINNNTPSYKGAIWNQAGARWYIQCNQVLDDDVGTGYEVFNNAGLLCKTNVSGTTTVYTYVNNTGGGTVQAQIGTIQIAAGSNLGGTFQAVSGAAIDFTGGNYFWNGTAVFEGPGTVAITGGSVTVTSYITSPLAVSGVTVTNLSNLGGSAYLTNVTITDAETIVGTVYWAGATVAVSGSLTVAANGVLDVVGSGNFQIEGPLTNNGTVNWLGGTVQVINNNTPSYKGAIWNQAGAQWFIQCSGQVLDDDVGTGYEIFNNAGLLCKTNISGTTTVYTVLNNSTGTADAEIGTIDFNGGYTLGAGSTLSFGLNSIASFGQISLPNTAALNGTLRAHLNDGYVPAVSSAFTILSYGAFTGGFNNTNLPSAVTWQTTYGSTALTIKVLGLGPTIPALSVLSRPPDMVLSWPTNASTFVLNRTASLRLPITWTPVTSGITVNGTNNTITINTSTGNQFVCIDRAITL